MMLVHTFTMEDVRHLTGGQLGIIDLPCPVCGPGSRKEYNRRRQVLRIWATEPGFASYFCTRCGLGGWTRAEVWGSLDAKHLGAVKAEIAQREHKYRQKQLEKAAWLYRRAGPLHKVPRYLAGRGITCALPATLRELRPRRSGHHLAMVMPFGEPNEPEPGLLGEVLLPETYSRRLSDSEADRPNFGIHLTLLAPDGLAKAGTGRDKLMIGPSAGQPLVIAPPNDVLGLVICEGIEDALSAHQVTGLGAWAAGAAGRLPALADRVPRYIEVVTILVDSDDAGRKHAGQLAMRLADRGFETRTIELGQLL